MGKGGREGENRLRMEGGGRVGWRKGREGGYISVLN